MAAQPAAAHDAKWGREASWTAVDFVPLVYYELGGPGRAGWKTGNSKEQE